MENHEAALRITNLIEDKWFKIHLMNTKSEEALKLAVISLNKTG